MIVVINVGSNKKYTVGRGPIFSDGTFKFIPIPESHDIKSGIEPNTYDDLGLSAFVPPECRNDYVHEDPEFVTYTYGHKERGWGDLKALKRLNKGDQLFFMATLNYRDRTQPKYPWINPDWGAYLVGFFKIKFVLTQDDFTQSSVNVRESFSRNAHYMRKEGKADLWIKGTYGKLFDAAIPLSDSTTSNKPNELITRIFTTVTGKTITEEKRLWYRWTLVCNKPDRISELWSEVLDKNPRLKETQLERKFIH